MSEFHYFLHAQHPDGLVTRDMHNEATWHALLQTMRQQSRTYAYSAAARPADVQFRVRLRCLMIGTVCVELLGEMACRQAIQRHDLYSKELYGLLYEMEKHFEATYQLATFNAVSFLFENTQKKEFKRATKARLNRR